MEEATLKEILNVVLDVKQELKEFKQETNQKFEKMDQQFEEMKQEINQINERVTTLEEGQKTMQKQIDEILREQADTRDIVKIIVNKLGEIDRKINEQAKDRCMFHKTLVGAKG